MNMFVVCSNVCGISQLTACWQLLAHARLVHGLQAQQQSGCVHGIADGQAVRCSRNGNGL